jgi:two-component system heavy metal sensor histidine kinase CusS
VQIRGDAQVVVQRPLLRRALNNLLQNAIQHGAGKAVIDVKIESEVDGMAQLTITNSSQMIAPDQLAHLLTAFIA